MKNFTLIYLLGICLLLGIAGCFSESKSENVSVTGVTLNKTTVTLTIGIAETLTATVSPTNATNKKLKWTTSNSGIATVDDTGKVTAVAVGTTIITATTSDGGKVASCTVTVNAATITVAGITLNKPTATLTIGSTETLTATITPENAANKGIKWSTSNSNIATVDESGKVTAVAVGTAVITATTIDGGKTATSNITVTTNEVQWQKLEEQSIGKNGGTFTCEKMNIEIGSGISADGGKLTFSKNNGSWDFKKDALSAIYQVEVSDVLSENIPLKIKIDIGDVSKEDKERIKLFAGAEMYSVSEGKSKYGFNVIENSKVEGNYITGEINIKSIEKAIKRSGGKSVKVAAVVSKNNDILTSGRFRIVGPYGNAINKKLLGYLDSVHAKLISIGFSQETIDGLWTSPLEVHIRETENSATYIGSFWGRSFDIIEVGYEALVSDKLKETLAHEYLHFVQACYEGGAISAVVTSPYAWIDESASCLFEAVIAENYDYVPDISEVYKLFFVQGVAGFYAGIDPIVKYDEGGSTNQKARHGYGAYFFLKYLVKKYNDPSILSELYKVIAAQKLGDRSSILALSAVLSNRHKTLIKDEFEAFLREYYTGNQGVDVITSVFGSINQYTGDPVYQWLIQDKTNKKFSNRRIYPDVSGFVYQIKLGGKFDIGENTDLLIEGNSFEETKGYFKGIVYDSQGKIITQFGDDNTKTIISNYENYKSKEIFLTVINKKVTSSQYDGKTPFEVKLSIAPYIEELNPAKGKAGDLITIKGNNFGKLQNDSYIMIGKEKITKVKTWGSNEIVFEFPDNIADTNNKINVFVDGISNDNDVNFELGVEKVEFDDAGFEKLIRWYTGKATGEITPADMLKVRSIDDNHTAVNSIKGIRFCKNLVYFSITRGENPVKISDLSELAGLTKLTRVACSGPVSDLTPLKNLREVTGLQFEDATFTDLTPLVGLTKIKEFTMYKNNQEKAMLSDISTLKNMPLLEEISIYNASITDLSALSDLSKLEYVTFDNNKITNISGLANKPDLLWVNIFQNQISDLSPLAGSPKLSRIYAPGNKIKSASVIESLTSLKEVYLDKNEITVFPNLSKLKELYLFSFNNNKISDIKNIAAFNTLPAPNFLTGELNLSHNNITDASAIGELKCFKYINLSYNQISSLAGIEKANHLEQINASYNQIENFKSLYSMSNLKNLYLYENNLTDVSGVEVMTYLKSLQLNSNKNLYTHKEVKDAKGAISNQETESYISIKKLGTVVSYDLNIKKIE